MSQFIWETYTYEYNHVTIYGVDSNKNPPESLLNLIKSGNIKHLVLQDIVSLIGAFSKQETYEGKCIEEFLIASGLQDLMKKYGNYLNDEMKRLNNENIDDIEFNKRTIAILAKIFEAINLTSNNYILEYLDSSIKQSQKMDFELKTNSQYVYEKKLEYNLFENYFNNISEKSYDSGDTVRTFLYSRLLQTPSIDVANKSTILFDERENDWIDKFIQLNKYRGKTIVLIAYNHLNPFRENNFIQCLARNRIMYYNNTFNKQYPKLDFYISEIGKKALLNKTFANELYKQKRFNDAFAIYKESVINLIFIFSVPLTKYDKFITEINILMELLNNMYAVILMTEEYSFGCLFYNKTIKPLLEKFKNFIKRESIDKANERFQKCCDKIHTN
jgi:hypothetical protein